MSSTGLGLSSRTPAVSTSESSAGTGTSTPSTPTTSSQSRLIASSPTLISGITSPPLLDSIKTIQGHGLLGPPKSERGRKKIKAENPGGPPVLVVPYPILASGETAKEGKTYRWGSRQEGVPVGMGQRLTPRAALGAQQPGLERGTAEAEGGGPVRRSGGLPVHPTRSLFMGRLGVPSQASVGLPGANLEASSPSLQAVQSPQVGERSENANPRTAPPEILI